MLRSFLKVYQDILWSCTMYEFRVDFSGLEVFEVLVEGFKCRNYDVEAKEWLLGRTLLCEGDGLWQLLSHRLIDVCAVIGQYFRY